MINFKKGDKVFDIIYGYGVVIRIDKKAQFPLLVSYHSAISPFPYTIEGKRNTCGVVTLSHHHYNRIEKRTDEEISRILEENGLSIFYTGGFPMLLKLNDLFVNIHPHDIRRCYMTIIPDRYYVGIDEIMEAVDAVIADINYKKTDWQDIP